MPDSTSRTLVLLALLAVVAWAIWLIRDVLPPFLIALGLALLFDPLIDRMQRRGLPRGLAVAITFAAVLTLFVAVIATVLPRLAEQVNELVRNLDVYGFRIEETVDRWALQHTETLRRVGLPPTISDVWREHQQEITGYLQVMLQNIFRSLQSYASALGWVVVIPIATLYLMIDLDRLKARIHHVIPSQHRSLVGNLSSQIGQVFAAYLRGLVMICSAFGIAVYVVLGMLFGLQYSIVLGLAAAVLYAVPILGQLTLLTVCALVAWGTGHPTGYVVGVAVCVLIVGQLFDQLITPRVMGRQVGIHPLLGIFALMVGGNLFGLVGMVVAVPAAASIRVVLIRLFPRLGEPIPGFGKRRKPRDEDDEDEPVTRPEIPAGEPEE